MVSKSSITASVVAIILIIIWIVAGGFITQANVKLSDFKKTDNNLESAYWTSFSAAFITWTLVGLLVIALIVMAVGGVVLFSTGIGETEIAVAGVAKTVTKKKPHTSMLAVSVLVIAVLLGALTGSLAIATSIYMKKSPNYDSTNEAMDTANKDAIIAAVICIGSIGLSGVALISYFIYINKMKQKVKKENEQYTENLILLAKQGKSVNASNVNNGSISNTTSSIYNSTKDTISSSLNSIV